MCSQGNKVRDASYICINVAFKCRSTFFLVPVSRDELASLALCIVYCDVLYPQPYFEEREGEDEADSEARRIKEALPAGWCVSEEFFHDFEKARAVTLEVCRMQDPEFMDILSRREESFLIFCSSLAQKVRSAACPQRVVGRKYAQLVAQGISQ